MHKKQKTYLLQAALFVVTIITTTLAGMHWMGLADYTWENFFKGLKYSIPFLAILTVHEFGHYLTAKYYRVKVTLPYYIPFFIPFAETIGTMGAFIRIKSPLKSRREVFDVGVAGPLAGFVLAMAVLYYGFTHLPEREYVFEIHPEYKAYGLDYDKHVYSYEFSKEMDSVRLAQIRKDTPSYNEEWPKKEYSGIALSKSLMIMFFEKYVADRPELIPNKYEMFHYPFIFAGFLALFFTALNLIPIGQLDGGHIVYGLLGVNGHRYVSVSAFIALVYFAGIGVFKDNFVGNVFGSMENLLLWGPMYLYLLYFIFSKVSMDWKNNLLIATGIFAAQYFTEFLFPEFKGISILYLVFSILVGRFLGVYHPPSYDSRPLDWKRQVIGWTALIIFVLCFTPDLFSVETFRP